MRVATAIAALLCLHCVSVTATRLSVFREEFNGVPGRTFIMVHPDGDTASLASAVPGGLDWISHQIALMRAVHTHMMLSLMPELPSVGGTAEEQQQLDPLGRVRCQRVRQAMREQEQATWRSEFGSVPDVASPMVDGPEVHNQDALCFDIHGNDVPCESEEAVMQDNWLDIERPTESPTRDAAAPTDPSTTTATVDPDVLSADQLPRFLADLQPQVHQQGDTSDQDLTGKLPGSDQPSSSSAQHASVDVPSESLDDQNSDWLLNLEARTRAGSLVDGFQGRGDVSAGDDLSDLLFFDHPRQMARQAALPTAAQRRPGPGDILLAATSVFGLAVVTIAAAVLLVLAVVRRQWAARGGVEGVLVAPLLGDDTALVKAYGVQVAAVEAERDAVRGIDTSAALLKGDSIPASH